MTFVLYQFDNFGSCDFSGFAFGNFDFSFFLIFPCSLRWPIARLPLDNGFLMYFLIVM